MYIKMIFHWLTFNKDLSLVKSSATWSMGLTYYAVVMAMSNGMGQVIITYQNSSDGNELVDPRLINQPGLLLLPWIRLT